MTARHDDYDLIPYWGKTYPQCHPDRMAALGTLLGMSPAPIEKCRVLELGCGDAVNLMGFAMVLPESEFLGIDLSKGHIAAGSEMAKSLGLKNISLFARDIMEDLSSVGRFDYIIAHGFYSWVPPEVQDRLLELCRSLLNPQGIVFVSYNTYPGAHLRMMLRDMMLFHTQGCDDPEQRIRQARALLGFLQTAYHGDDPYLLLMKKESERIQSFPAAHLFHDDLAQFYNPVYFHQFMAHAQRHGLKYLTEADYHETQDGNFPEEAACILKTMEGSPLTREQYIDFLRCRRFRQTLLCHDDAEISLVPQEELIRKLRISAQIRPVQQQETGPAGAHFRFEHARGGSFTIELPEFNEALTLLGSLWPASIPFDVLAEKALLKVRRDKVQSGLKPEDTSLLAGLFLRLHAANLVELHTFEPPFAAAPGIKPLASPLARLKLKDNRLIPNLRHYNVSVDDPLMKQVLLLLDGTRDLAALTREIMQLVRSGELPFRMGSSQDSPLEEGLRAAVQSSLADLARYGLLMNDSSR